MRVSSLAFAAVGIARIGGALGHAVPERREDARTTGLLLGTVTQAH
jgi:hypothetical protein